MAVPVATFPRNFGSHVEADHLVAFSYEQLFQGAQPALATEWGVCLCSSYYLVLDDWSQILVFHLPNIGGECGGVFPTSVVKITFVII